MSTIKNFLVIALCLSFIGCATTSSRQEKPFVDPQYGMTQLQLVHLLGKPNAIEIYQKSNQTRLDFYMYVKTDGSSQEKVPVCLINKKVVGWGQTFYEDHVSLDDIRIK